MVSEYFYHHPISCGGHFPKESYEYFTNNFIHVQFFISPGLGLVSLYQSCGKSINYSSMFLLDVINFSIELILDEF